MEAMEAQGVEIGSYFQQLMLAVPANIDEPELLLTRILCCGNLMIVVSYVRRLAYESLLDISLATPRYNDYLLATLKGIHVRLGVSSVSQLFETFLLYYSWRKTTTAEPNFLQQLPAKVCGYVSAGQRAQSVFMQLGGFFQSLEDKENFTALRKAASYSSSTDAFLDCFAEYAAQNLLSTADGCIQAGEDPSASLETSLGRINEIFSTNVTASIPFDSFFVSSSDRILASVFSRMHSMTFDATSPIAQILAERWAGANPQLAPFYQRLVSGAPPFCLYAQGQEYDVYTCLQVCSLILKSLPSPDYHLPVAYNIVQHLVSDIATASFLDDKRRLLGVLAVALVVFRQSAQDPAVIRIVLHGCAHLYRQADLASQCYPIFCTMMQVHQTYVESFTSRTAEIIKTLPSVLVEMSRTAQSHHQNSSYSHLADIFAGHLFHLREDILASLGSSSDERLQRQARLAQMLWPASPKDLLFSVSELEHALRSPSDLGSNIFELVHPLSKAADSDTSIPSSRLSTSLWIVLSLTNQDSEIKPVAASALARLVKRCQGRITPPPLTKDNLKGSSFYGRLPIYQEASNVDLFRRILVDLTAGLLLSSDLTLNEAASRTLRAVFDLAPRGTFEASTSLEDSARDLVCLASPLLRRPPRNLPKDKPRHGLEDLRKWMRPNVATSPEWTSGVSEVLLSLLSAHDPFFSKFNHLICLSKSFARDVFPVLVYCLLSLRHEESGEVSMLEDLFNAILLQDFSPLDAVGSVVDAMLYLRHFEQGQPPQSSLSGDRWLGISWKAVAHGAMRSHGAPTALLCMELAHEQTLGGGAPQPSSSALLQLEYEMYGPLSHLFLQN